MSRTDGADAADPIGGRVVRSRWKRWLLLSGRRKVVVLLASLAVFVVLIAFAILSPAPLRSLMDPTPPTGPLFQAMIIAVVTGVTLVVTLAQLVLSQELGSAGDQHERMEGALSFRDEIEDRIGSDVAPVETAGLLRALVAACGERAAALRTAADDVADADRRERLQRYAAELESDASIVAGALDDARSSTFRVVLAALHFDYTRKMHRARRFERAGDEDLPEPVTRALDDLVETLAYVGSAREHVKTLYFQGELIHLARDVAYAGVPALLASIGMVLYGGALTDFSVTVLGVDVLVWLVSAAATLAVVPFLVLLAYILRVVTVAQLTLAIGPVELQETVQPEEARGNE